MHSWLGILILLLGCMVDLQLTDGLTDRFVDQLMQSISIVEETNIEHSISYRLIGDCEWNTACELV